MYFSEDASEGALFSLTAVLASVCSVPGLISVIQLLNSLFARETSAVESIF